MRYQYQKTAPDGAIPGENQPQELRIAFRLIRLVVSAHPSLSYAFVAAEDRWGLPSPALTRAAGLCLLP